jgi:DNA-binding transcriptional LysR family regulator
VSKLSSIDLNLLVALDALLEESNVTRAAARSGVSQSAMSHSLRRLRHLMKDPLLVRVGNCTRLTPRAHSLRHPVRDAIAKLEAVLATSEGIDPLGLERTFRLQAYDTTQLLVVPALSRQLEECAPRVRLEIQDLTLSNFSERLSAGDTDLALFWLADVELPSWVAQEPLFTDRHVCLVRRDLPGVGQVLDWPTYARFKHVVVQPRGTEYPLSREIERALEERGFERRKSLTVSGLLLVPAVLSSSDLVAIVSERSADILCSCFPLRKVEPPFVSVAHEVSMFWDARLGQDPAHRWLRKLIIELCVNIDRVQPPYLATADCARPDRLDLRAAGLATDKSN